MKLKGKVFCVSWLLALSAFAYGQANQGKQGSTVFRIGAFDRSSIEFSSRTPQEPVKFVVGKSDTSKDWYGTQAAELTTAKENNVASSPRAIVYSISQAPAKAYQFHVALMVESASVPALRVGINGKHGIFYLHPKLDYSNGDQGDSFYPASSYADIQFTFPGEYLQRGENTVTLQVVEDSDQVIPGASLTYDAIELASSEAKLESPSAELAPTIFYNEKNGKINEEVDAFIRHQGPVKAGDRVDLTLAGQHFQQTLSGSQDFGEERVQFSVPEFPAQSTAKLAWQLGGKHGQMDQRISPERKWTLLLVPHIHVDIGYSDYQAKVAAIQSRVIDEAMDMVAHQPDFRYSLDGEWDLEQFLRTRSDAERQQVIESIQKKGLFVPAQYVNLLTGFPTAETLIRSLYPSANFSRVHKTPFNYANITDVPSYSWSYASILAAAGVDSVAGGSNNYRAPVLLQGRLNEDSPVWWEGPDGKKVLLWYSRIYQQMQMLFGLPPVLSAGRDTLPLFLQAYNRPGYLANSVILYGTQVENTDLFQKQSELAKLWNSRYAYPRLKYTGFHDALQEIKQQFGANIPTIRGDGGPYWEDGIGADACYAAMERWNEGRGPSAEKFATLTSLVDSKVQPDFGALNKMWKNMVLMDEHTWGSYNSISQPNTTEAVEQLVIKDQFAIDAHSLADWVVKSSLANISHSIPVVPGDLVVFNSLNWKRSGPVTVDLDNGRKIVDLSSGETVPVEVLSKGNGFSHVRFTATDVPSMGYKSYAMRPADKDESISQAVQGATIENSYYKVTLDEDSGAIRSIFDKQLGKELVNENSPYRFGQYLYVTGGDKAPNTLLQYSRVYPKAELQVHAAGHGHLVSITRTPDGYAARLQSEDTNTPKIAAEIRIFDHEKKIEIVEDIDKKEELAKEAAYFAFPFAMDHPQFQYEVQNGVVDPAKDMYPGAGHEWFSVQHWVSAQQDGVSGTVMPLDASLVTLGDINRGEWPEEFKNRPGSIFSYIMNNYWDTNYRAAQGGHFQFHYLITSATSTNPQQLSRLGWEEITPLEVNVITTQDKALSQNLENSGPEYPDSVAQAKMLHIENPLGEKSDSFLTVSDPDVLLQTWKVAEDRNGTILRFLDLGGARRTITVHLPMINIAKSTQTDAVERDQKALPLTGGHDFEFTIDHDEIVTVRINDGRSKNSSDQ